MKLRVNATALVAAATLSLGVPAAAATVPIDYTLSASQNGITVTFGTMILDYDGSAYSLESLVLSVPKRTTVVTSDVTLSPVPGSSDYCLYTFLTCSIVPEKNSLYVIFDPSLTSQTSPLYVYSTTNSATESFSIIIARAVPEPATWATLLLGLGGIGASLRWRRPRVISA